jgi:hypothetical protein
MKIVRPFEKAIVGTASVWKRTEEGLTPISTVVYDREKIIQLLVTESGLSRDEAIEYISYNIEGRYEGDMTPIILWPKEDK